MIKIRDITLQFPNKTVLQNFSADIKSGERIGIFGPNGAGKSTLLKALLRIIPLTSGSISINETASIAYLPQDFDALPLDYSVIGFLMLLIRSEQFGLPLLKKADHQQCDEALTQVGALHLKNATLRKLSGGERKRVMLAGILLSQPTVLLLDEPLANLDLRYQKEMLNLMNDLQKKLNLTLLITAHDFNPLLPMLDRVLFIGEGQGILDLPEKVIEDQVLSTLYKTPLHVVDVQGRKFVLSTEQSNFLNSSTDNHGDAHV